MAAAQMSLSTLAAPCGLAASSLATSRKASAKVSALSTRRSLAVRAEASKENTPITSTETSTPATPATPTPVVKIATPGLSEVMAFSGPAPETINGRLAMLGFTAALAVEVASGAPLTSQLASTSNVSWMLFSIGLISAASLIPLFQGVSVKSKSGGFFNENAEVLNGRAAMIGLVALALTEFVNGGSALF